jgi:CheY-like chemotaxis protein
VRDEDQAHGAEAGAPRPRVLVVDDDAMLRALMERQLESGGYEVTVAASGRQGLALLHDGARVDAVVTDLRMDEGSGGWFLAHLGYDFPELLARTLVISGDAQGAGAAHIRARWHCPVLAKPFTAAELVATLDRIRRG